MGMFDLELFSITNSPSVSVLSLLSFPDNHLNVIVSLVNQKPVLIEIGIGVSSKKLGLCCSALKTPERWNCRKLFLILRDHLELQFQKVGSECHHVILPTDEKGACRITLAYKGYIQDLIIAAGGTILRGKPIGEDQKTLSGSSTCQTFVIDSLELPDKCDPSKKVTILDRGPSDAETLASSTGAKVASDSWVLESKAACNLHNLGE
ncbi:hypothetical protein CJ030_MR2G022282 [Morella rubra]|uniref:BRCT domain-containing protein n=1 Tax=Morella rubra TaxID=262757 RepID=A0A6A1WC95_9ROSI|nr:hypothetical protein CJ030_MR7G017743 [Morella rubra]KAB1222791.1 hypothetical protein CJ030_MR2G022282 [Morella rubra]